MTQSTLIRMTPDNSVLILTEVLLKTIHFLVKCIRECLSISSSKSHHLTSKLNSTIAVLKLFLGSLVRLFSCISKLCTFISVRNTVVSTGTNRENHVLTTNILSYIISGSFEPLHCNSFLVQLIVDLTLINFFEDISNGSKSCGHYVSIPPRMDWTVASLVFLSFILEEST